MSDRRTLATGFWCFVLGLTIAGFVGTLESSELRRERNEARAVCLQR